MKQIKLIIFLLLAALIWAPAVLAEEEWTPRDDMPSIVDLIAADDDFDTFEAALKTAGIAEHIAVNGPFTVFVPTDEAFAKLPAGMLNDLLADQKMLTDVILYHMCQGDMGPEIAATITEEHMMNGETVYVKIFEDDVYLNDSARVVEADIIGMNGRIHGINTVLIPPVLKMEMVRQEVGVVKAVAGGETILDIAAVDSRLDTFMKAVEITDLGFDLAAAGSMTVFAPTDEAFARLPEGMLDDLLKNPTALRNLLLYHVQSGDFSKEEAFVNREMSSVTGEIQFIKVYKNEVYINDLAQVIEPDILASNGRIHVIDEVLIPQAMASKPAPVPLVLTLDEEVDYETYSIPEVVAADARFSTLLKALEAADLVATLEGAGPYTVFAPTDAAFARLPKATLNALLADPKGELTEVLLNHVASGLLASEEARSLTEKGMLGGEMLGIKVYKDNVYLNDVALITIQDVVAENGIIHVIDTVLVPAVD